VEKGGAHPPHSVATKSYREKTEGRLVYQRSSLIWFGGLEKKLNMIYKNKIIAYVQALT